MEKQHATKCASHRHKYSGDMRNIKMYEDIMLDCDCDGYHTFTELYNHRITLFITFCRKLAEGCTEGCGDSGDEIWRSKYHSDGELCFGTGTQFIMGIGTKKGEQISYHIPIERWGETEFAKTLKKAPEFDGHTSDDVITRLKNI